MRHEPQRDAIDPAVDPTVQNGRGFGVGVAHAVTEVFPVGEHERGWTRRAVAKRAVTDFNVRCPHKVRMHGTDGLERVCNALLGIRLTRPYTLQCRKCKNEIKVEAEE